jgi:hypothetical protein
MVRWRYYLGFWSRRTTATVVPAATPGQARSRVQARRKTGYGTMVSLQRANDADSRLIRKGIWVRRRRDGSSPQFGNSNTRATARRQRSGYRPWL